MSNETYLGDGLYASYDGWQFCLRAPRGPGGDHVVYLEPSVLAEFQRYVLRATAAPTIEQEDAEEIEAETAARVFRPTRIAVPNECPKCGPSCQCDIAWNE